MSSLHSSCQEATCAPLGYNVIHVPGSDLRQPVGVDAGSFSSGIYWA